MDDYYSPAGIFGRFRRTLLTHEQDDADIFFQKASELVPDIEAEFGKDLSDFEKFLLGALLGQIREVQELKGIVNKFREMIGS